MSQGADGARPRVAIPQDITRQSRDRLSFLPNFSEIAPPVREPTKHPTIKREAETGRVINATHQET